MIRKIVVIFVFLLSMISLYAEEELTFTATVPEDYGVVMPEGVLMFDKFAINIEVSNEHEFLLMQDMLYLGDIVEAEVNSLDFTMLYYGNLAQPYDVRIEIDPGYGWYLWQDAEEYRIPISVGYSRPSNLSSDVYLTGVENDSAHVAVMPSGPKAALPVLNVNMTWEGDRNLIPGVYQADLKVKVDVL